MQRLIRTLFVAGSLAASPVMAQELDITITNLTHGTYFTPLLVSAHAGGNHLFQPGVAATAHLQAMAEGGDISGLAADMSAVGADNEENPAGGLLAPGASAQFSMSTASGNDHLSLSAMLLPTNDGFVGLDALSIPATAGTYRYTLNGYDAGTEANDEIVNGGGTPGVAGIPADPGGAAGSGAGGVTGSEANTVVHIHRGVLGDTNASGGSSDLDSRVHRWLNPVAELVITVN
jgi:hypothetical protein